MKKTSSVTVRLTQRQKDGLSILADRYSVEAADVLRWALVALLNHAEAHGGRIVLPVDFSQTFSVQPAPMILHESPRAQSRSTRVAGDSRNQKRARRSGVRG